MGVLVRSRVENRDAAASPQRPPWNSSRFRRVWWSRFMYELVL